jgi:hypothetical protein
MSQQWVSEYDLEPVQQNKPHKVQECGTFHGYNVWGFKNEDWRKKSSRRNL